MTYEDGRCWPIFLLNSLIRRWETAFSTGKLKSQGCFKGGRLSLLRRDTIKSISRAVATDLQGLDCFLIGLLNSQIQILGAQDPIPFVAFLTSKCFVFIPRNKVTESSIWLKACVCISYQLAQYLAIFSPSILLVLNFGKFNYGRETHYWLSIWLSIWHPQYLHIRP